MKLLVCVFLLFAGLFPAGFAPGGAAAWAAEGMVIRVEPDCAIHTMAGGIGASWHAIEKPIPVEGGRSHGGSAWGGNPPAEDAEAWRQLYRQADWLGLDFCRVELEQRMYEPARGRFSWDTPEMRILYRILDWCERRKVDVFLQQMWGNVEWNTFPEWRGDAVKIVHSGPYVLEDYADGIAALAEHLVKQRKYTCIKWICINNEPGWDWSWWQRPPNSPMSLKEGLEATRKALDARQVSIPLSGPDLTDLPKLDASKIDYDGVIGAYDLHSYYCKPDWFDGPGYPASEAILRLREWADWAHGRGKPLFLSEVGTMVFGWNGTNPGPATFDAALKDAQLVIRGLNAGVDGFNRWSFVNRGDLDGHWQLVDTWDPVGQRLLKTFVPKPNPYFTYGLISRFAAKHSTVVKTTVTGGRDGAVQRVFSSAVLSPKGSLTLFVLNDSTNAYSASIIFDGGKHKRLWKYQMSAALANNPGLTIGPVGPRLLRGGEGLNETVPALSLTVFSTLKRNHANRGEQ